MCSFFPQSIYDFECNKCRGLTHFAFQATLILEMSKFVALQPVLPLWPASFRL